MLGLLLEFYCVWYLLPALICLVRKPRIFFWRELDQMTFLYSVISSIDAYVSSIPVIAKELWLVHYSLPGSPKELAVS